MSFYGHGGLGHRRGPTMTGPIEPILQKRLVETRTPARVCLMEGLFDVPSLPVLQVQSPQADASRLSQKFLGQIHGFRNPL